MSERGFIVINRKILDNPLLKDPHYFRAWVWFLCEAAWKPRETRIVCGRTTSIITLQRAQFSHSRRYISEELGCSEQTIRSTIKRFQNEQMIHLQTIQGQMVITICKYDGYQFNSETDNQQTNQQTNQQSTGEPTQSKEDNKLRTEKKKEEVPAVAADDDLFAGEPELGPVHSAEDRFWQLDQKFAAAKLPRSRLGQLAKAHNGDFETALQIAHAVLKAKNPNSYLGAILRNLRDEATPPVRAAFDPNLPGFVSAAKAEGMRVEKHRLGWKINNEVFDPGGQLVGA